MTPNTASRSKHWLSTLREADPLAPALTGETQALAVQPDSHCPSRSWLAMVRQLADAGYLERRDSTWQEGADEWTTTVSGGALTMASFFKPMPQTRADKLLAGGARASGGPQRRRAERDPGSHCVRLDLRPEVTELGDLDLAVKSSPREPSPGFSKTVVSYARASGRQFSSFMDELAWGEVELRQLLRNRGG